MENARLDLLTAAPLLEMGGVPALAVLTDEERQGYDAWLGFVPAMRAGGTIDEASDPFGAYHRLFAALVRAMIACDGDAAIVLDDDAQLVRRAARAVSVHRSPDLVTPEMLAMIPRPFSRRGLKHRPAS